MLACNPPVWGCAAVLLIAVASPRSFAQDPLPVGGGVGGTGGAAPPHVLVVVADDWSWPHVPGVAETEVSTPNFDRMVAEGVRFDHAFAPAPSCTASRSSMLTGQPMWRLGEGANLWGTLGVEHPVYPDLLEQAGYHVGYWKKGWGPGDDTAGGRTRNPAGPRYDSFDTFLAARPAGTPFCFWLGSHDPHRPYPAGAGVAAGKDPEAVQVPPYLPDDPVVRSDLCDYYVAVEQFDTQLGDALRSLENAGLLQDTLVIVTSDNGLPFPRGKATLYDGGTLVPLVMRWQDHILGGRTVTDFVSLAGIAPTVLQAAGVAVPPEMTARTLLPLALALESGRLDPTRSAMLTGSERHVPTRRCPRLGYPARAIRSDDYLYIENDAPTRWPAGHPLASSSYVGRSFADVDPSPTKSLMIARQAEPMVAPLFALAFQHRPARELYDLQSDPFQLSNVAGLPQYAAIEATLATRLQKDLTAFGDPRTMGGGTEFDAYPYRDPTVLPPPFDTDALRLSVTAGGRQAMTLVAGPTLAGTTYFILGSTSGTVPGVPFGGQILPLNPDPYTAAAPTRIAAWTGVLDASGSASASFDLPPGLDPSFAGTVIDHCFVVFDPVTGDLLGISNPCDVILDP
jgi:arylsulfatase A-like enzyme